MGKKKSTETATSAPAVETATPAAVTETAPAPKKTRPRKAAPKTETGAKVTIDKSIYRIGDLAFGISSDSINATVKMMESLSDDDLAKIVSLHGVSDADPSRIKTLAQSFVQMDWYEHYKGDTPMSVKKGHAARVADKSTKSTTKSNGKSNGKRAPRGQKLRFSAKVKDVSETFGGKAATIAALLVKGAPMSARELQDAMVKKTGDAKDDKIVQWFVWKNKREGLIVGA